METIYPDGSPLATYLEGQGVYDPDFDVHYESHKSPSDLHDHDSALNPDFAPRATNTPYPRIRTADLPPIVIHTSPQSAISRVHHAWSSAVNSRLRRADNAKFLEHFRYILVASQLLNEYLDQGALQPRTVSAAAERTTARSGAQTISLSIYGALVTAAAAFAVVYLVHYARSSRGSNESKSRAALIILGFVLVVMVGYACVRRQWLRFLRDEAVDTASGLTTNWQAYELSLGSSLAFIQEVELVSKGYKISTPMPPISRLEDQSGIRRCARLRNAVHKAFAATIPACIDACTALRPLIDVDDLERYYDVYDISLSDAREALGSGSLDVLEDDPESLKSLRVLSYRSGILRRITLCSLMALEADGGMPDFNRWRAATITMATLSRTLATSAERVRQILGEMETLNIPPTPTTSSFNAPARERFRSQVRKISMLSSGIRGLQAKMQILREETNHSIASATDDLVDLGPNLLAQYDAIGQDLRELMQAWESGRASLQNKIFHHESRRSIASSTGLQSRVTSLSGLTAVEEAESDSSSPTDTSEPVAQNSKGYRSSLPAGPIADDHSPTVYEAIALPRQRVRSSTSTTTTREARIARMNEERERQAQVRARREANTSMLRELESVINLRPKKGLENGSAASPTATVAPL